MTIADAAVAAAPPMVAHVLTSNIYETGTINGDAASLSGCNINHLDFIRFHSPKPSLPGLRAL